MQKAHTVQTICVNMRPKYVLWSHLPCPESETVAAAVVVID